MSHCHLQGSEFPSIQVAPGVKALLFDCDGTLADTMPLHWKAWHACLAEWGVSCPHEALEKFSGTPILETIRELNRRFAWTIDEQEFAARKKLAVLEYLQKAAPIVPVVNLVKAKYEEMPMAVVSGGALREVHTTLTALGIKDMFQRVITADDGLPRKPSPQPFLVAARYLGVSAENCQVFEDADEGIAAGLAAGMVVTDVRRTIRSSG